MPRSDKIYIALCAFFSVLLVLGNLIYQKFVYLPLLPFHIFELSVGAILYPLTFLVTILITEFYGKEKARFCVRIAVGMNVLVALAVSGMGSLEATEYSKIDNDTFQRVFGLYTVAFIGSVIACYTAQMVDISIYSGIHKITGDKWLWLRNWGSTTISLFIDTSLVISFMALFGVLPVERLWILIGNAYGFKLLFIICSTPFFYLAFFLLRGLIGNLPAKPFPQENETHKAAA